MPTSGTWGDIRRYLGLSGLVEGILLALVGGSQGCCSISYRAQESPPNNYTTLMSAAPRGKSPESACTHVLHNVHIPGFHPGTILPPGEVWRHCVITAGQALLAGSR